MSQVYRLVQLSRSFAVVELAGKIHDMIIGRGADRLIGVLFDWQPEVIFQRIDASTRVQPAVEDVEENLTPWHMTCIYESVPGCFKLGGVYLPLLVSNELVTIPSWRGIRTFRALPASKHKPTPIMHSCRDRSLLGHTKGTKICRLWSAAMCYENNTTSHSYRESLSIRPPVSIIP